MNRNILLSCAVLTVIAGPATAMIAPDFVPEEIAEQQAAKPQAAAPQAAAPRRFVATGGNDFLATENRANQRLLELEVMNLFTADVRSNNSKISAMPNDQALQTVERIFAESASLGISDRVKGCLNNPRVAPTLEALKKQQPEVMERVIAFLGHGKKGRALPPSYAQAVAEAKEPVAG